MCRKVRVPPTSSNPEARSPRSCHSQICARSSCVSVPTPATATPERLSACSGLRQRCPHLPRTSRVAHARYVGRNFRKLDVFDHSVLCSRSSHYTTTRTARTARTRHAPRVLVLAPPPAPRPLCPPHWQVAGAPPTPATLQRCSCWRRLAARAAGDPLARATNRSASAAGDPSTSSRAAAAAATAAA